MHSPAFFYCIASFGLFLILAGCPNKDESVQVPTMTPAQEEAASEAPGAAAGEPQMNRALAIHREFVTAFSETLKDGDTEEALRERMDLADRTRLNGMMLRADLSDPDAAAFLVRFTDLLQRYIDLAARHLVTLDEVSGLHARGKEMQARIAALPDKDKPQATKEFNAVVDRHNSLVQGLLAQERKDLEALGNELLELR